MKTETENTRDLTKRLKRTGARFLAIFGNRYSEPGWPDRFITAKGLPGGCGWVEFKNPNGKIKKEQKEKLDDLTKRGALAVVYWFGINVFTDSDKNVIGKADWKDAQAWLTELKRLGQSCLSTRPTLDGSSGA